MTDPTGAVTTHTYDASRRRTATRDPLGNTTTSAYDPAGRPSSLRDPIGAAWLMTYDATGNLVSETDPQGRTTTSTYDSAHRRLFVSDGRGVLVSFTYDQTGRVLTTTSPHGTSTSTYDAAGRMVSSSDASGATTYAYDQAGNATVVSSPQGTLAYTYDAAGRRASMSTPAGQVIYAYDPTGNLSAITDPQGHVATFSYDPARRRTSATYLGVTSTSTYDPTGRLVSLAHATPSTTLASYALTYDATGNTTAIATPAGTRTFTYDATRRLRSQTTPEATTSYTYDPAGNATSTTGPGGTTTYAYSPSGELTSIGTQGVSHDAAGNVTSIGTDTFSYDAFSRLTSANVAGTPHTATYDAQGIRVSLDGTAHLMDRLGGLATLVADATHTYVRAQDFAASLDATSATSLLEDPTGSIATLVDASGTTTGSVTYDAFGTKATTGATSALGFTGEEHDPSGLVHLRARTYAPALGRFLQPDPIQPAGPGTLGWNRYIYAADNPLSFTDPTGAFPFSLGEQTSVSAAESDLQAGSGSGAWATARLIISRLQTYLYRAASSRIAQCLMANEVDPTNQTGADIAIDLVSGCVGEMLEVAGKNRRLLSGFRRGASSVCGANSFAPATPVLMANGERRAISEIREGDMVLATDPETGESGAREVVATLPHTDQLLTLRTSSGEIVTTEDHRYWNVTDREWQESQDLDEGDRLLTADGDIVTVEGLDWTTLHTDAAYDLTVGDLHTFYVGAGDESVLVHNCFGYSDKILGQMGPRGWTDDLVQETVSNPAATRHPVWDYTTGTKQPATAYATADNALNRPGLLGGSRPWKRGWSHAKGTVAWEAEHPTLRPRGEGPGRAAGPPAPQGARD